MSGEVPLSENDPRPRNDRRLGAAQPEDGSRPRCSNVAAVPGNPTFHNPPEVGFSQLQDFQKK